MPGPKTIPTIHIHLPHGGRKIFVGGVTGDGGGYIITLGGDGHVVIKRIPPWDPGVSVLSPLDAALGLMAQAEASRDTKARKQLQSLAQQMLAKNEPAIVEALSGLQG